MLFQRIGSGLDFLDATIGGLYSNRVYLVRGPSQSGRTTVSLQFLMDGLENGENTMMVSNDRIENVILKAETMGLSLENAIMENRLILMEYPKEIGSADFQYSHIINLLGEIEQYIKHYKCTRLVFDTLIPLLSNQERTHLVNFIYSLINSLEELDVTTLVVAGEPNSPVAQKIIQLLEDAVVGSFSLSSISNLEGEQRIMTVHKMVEPMKPPSVFKIKFEYGVGLVLDKQGPKTHLPQSNSVLKISEIMDLAVHVAIVGNDDDTTVQIEEIFHPESNIMVFDTQEEFIQQMYHMDIDLLIINLINPTINWREIIQACSEPFPNLPKFVAVDRNNRRLTHQSVKLIGGDGLFIKPIDPNDLIAAYTKSLKGYGTLNALVTKRRVDTPTADMPDDFSSVPEELEEKIAGESDINVMTPQAFRENLHRQVWHSRQNQTSLTLVSFKIMYTTTYAQQEDAPQGLELVKKVASIVQSTLRGLDDSTCRYMDKVVVLLEDTEKASATAFIRRVVAELKSELASQMNIYIGKHLNILSAVVSYPEDSDNGDDLMFQVTDVSRNFVKSTM